jgi:hypothetical protein
VEIAIGILRADPKEDVTPARLGARYHREELRRALLPTRPRGPSAQAFVSEGRLTGYGGIEGVDGFPGLLGAMMKKESFPVMKLPELNQSITLSQTSGRKPRSDPEAQILRHRKASGLKHHRS